MKQNKHAQALGRKGGEARAKNLSKRALSEIGSKGAEARWGKRKKRRKTACKMPSGMQ